MRFYPNNLYCYYNYHFFLPLQFANHIKKSEAGTKASKLRKVDLKISIDNVKIEDTKTKVRHHRMSTKDLDHAGCV